jgi:hypothetical protein
MPKRNARRLSAKEQAWVLKALGPLTMPTVVKLLDMFGYVVIFKDKRRKRR